MGHNKHILFLTPGFPKDESDLNCIPPLQEFLIKFQQTFPDYLISIIAFQYPYHRNHYLWKGIGVYPLGGSNSKIKKPSVWKRGIKTAKNINQRNTIDAIHSLWLGECAMIGNVLSNKINCRHICTLMGQDVKKSNWYLKFFNKNIHKTIALSVNQANRYYKLTNRNPDEIINWGIDSIQFSETHRDIDLLAVGSIISLKNYSLFINVVMDLVSTKPNLKAVLVGNGPELQKLKRIALRSDLDRNIEFKGLVNRKDVFSLMRRSKIFVHTSLFEGAGYVFAEALANGMNIISFDVGYAEAGSKWQIAKDEKDFIIKTRNMLDSDLDFNPLNRFPIKETVNKYAELYEVC